MTFRLNCLEPVAAMCCAVGAVSLHALDPGLAAGAVIGGVGLFARLRENMRKSGLEAPELVRKMRLAVIREEDRWDQSDEDRDTLVLADAAMGQWLPEVMLSREELARSAAARADLPYPRYAALLIVDRLAGKDPQFAAAQGAAEPLPRRFARTVIERALGVALDDPEYSSRLSVDFLIAISSTLAEIKAQNDATHAKLDALPETLRAIVLEILGPALAKGVQTDAVIALARTVAPTVQNADEAVTQLGSAIEAYIRLRDAAARGTNFGDLVDAALREIAERNAAEDFESAAKAAEQAYTRLLEQESELKAAQIRMAEVNLDQARLLSNPERISHWHMEIFALEGDLFSKAYSELQVYRHRGLVQGSRLDLDVSIAMSERLLELTTADRERALVANAVGIAASDQGERTAGEAGFALLTKAAAAYRVALDSAPQQTQPDTWASVQNNLGAVLFAHGMRYRGKERAALLEEAISAYRAALTVRTKQRNPGHWASTQSNLAAALRPLAEMTEGQETPDLLTEAIAILRSALTVFTEEENSWNWATTQNNLGGALLTLGRLTPGAEGAALLAEGITTLESCLSIFTREDMPTYWATIQFNIAIAHDTLATLDANPMANLARAEAKLLEVLEIVTEEEMSLDYEKATRFLTKVRETRATLTR